MSALPAETSPVEPVVDQRGRPRARQIDWPQIATVAPVLAATLQRYLAQLALSLRHGSLVKADGILREFAGYLTEHTDVVRLVDVERHHVEAFKRHRLDMKKTVCVCRFFHLSQSARYWVVDKILWWSTAGH